MQPRSTVRSRTSTLAAVLALAGCASAGSRSPTTSAAPADSVRLGAIAIPRELGEFRAVGEKTYDDPRLGIQIRYEGPGVLAADVYVYPVLPQSLTATAAGLDSAAKTQYRQARSDIFEYQTRQKQPAPRVLAETDVRAPAEPGRVAVGHRGSFAFWRDGRMVTSHLWVFTTRDRYVKVRASYAATEGPEQPPPELVRFVEAVLASVAAEWIPYGETPPRPPDEW